MDDIVDDKREIEAIYYNDEGDSFHKVGVSGCTKIEAYGEPGQYCYIPWIAIYYNNDLKRRLPATMVEIVYRTED